MEFEDLLERYCFEKYVLDVCIATLERGGVTSKLDTYEFISPTDEAWGLPKYPDKTAILPPGADLAQAITEFIHANEVYLREPGSWLGTWIDPSTNICYLDITAIYFRIEDAMSQATALSSKTQRKIVALYDFKREQPVYL
jgi:hypothetical protein